MRFQRAVLWALTGSVLGGCDRKPKDAPAQTPASTAPATAAKSGCTLAAIPLTVPGKPQRLVAMGDLHGDLQAARAALKAASLIDESDHWTGGDTWLVQTGDLLDRGDGESKIFELFDRLSTEAKAAGGAIVMLDGNHELMNAAHDFRYVTPGGMSDFGGDRGAAFGPGGPWAKKLATRNLVAIVDGNVFSHAGVVAEWASHLDDENLAARCWLDGQAGTFDDPPRMLTSQSSPVWTRDYGFPDKVDCAALDRVLQTLGARRMIVAHTPQDSGITSGCDGKLWRIDVGMTAKYGGPIEVLEVVPEPKVLQGTR
jgi:hypothetical protein